MIPDTWTKPKFTFGQHVRCADWGKDDESVIVVGMRFCVHRLGPLWTYTVAPNAVFEPSFVDTYDEDELIAAY